MVGSVLLVLLIDALFGVVFLRGRALGAVNGVVVPHAADRFCAFTSP